MEISGTKNDPQINSQNAKNDTAPGKRKGRETVEYSAAASGKRSINVWLFN